MEMTIFLASLWGPALFALGIGFFASPGYYAKIYRDIEHEAFALMAVGLGGIAAAIAQISVHNVWETLPQIIVSLLGWATLVKAAVFVIKPDIADKGGDWAAASRIMPLSGGLMVVIGAYLSWVAYFA